MAKLQDKFFNRVIEGHLEVTDEEAKKIAKAGIYLVDNVKALSKDVISQLEAGDIVVKHDASGNHPYIVSFRGETGICLTYTDASCVETQSYDLVDGQWVYNSEDKTDITNAKPIYYHPIFLRDYTNAVRCTLAILDNNPNAYTSINQVRTKLKDLLNLGAKIQVNGFMIISNVCYNIFIITHDAENSYTMYGNDVDGNQQAFELDSFDADTIVDDGVNKIN